MKKARFEWKIALEENASLGFVSDKDNLQRAVLIQGDREYIHPCMHSRHSLSIGADSTNTFQCFPKLSYIELNALVTELAEVGWDNISLVDEDLQFVELGVVDKSKRVHKLRVNLLSRDGVSDALPLPIAPQTTLEETKRRFEQQLSSYSFCWDQLDEIDSQYLVLDPPLPVARSVLRRRLGLESTTGEPIPTLFLEIRMLASSSANGNRRCLVDVIGHPTESETWCERVARIQWDHSTSICSNINISCKGLGQIAKKKNFNGNAEESIEEGPTVECGVCYVYRLVDMANNHAELPDQSCGECKRPYHRSCLASWLQALPTSRQIFNAFVGDCPYCGKTISLSSK